MFSILPDNSAEQPPDTKVGNIRIKQVILVLIRAIAIVQSFSKVIIIIL